MSKDFKKLHFSFLGSFSMQNCFYRTKIWWIVVSVTRNKIQKSKKISQGDVRIFHFQMRKTFVKTHQNSIPRSPNQIHRILSKFVHPSFMTLIRTYYVIAEILAVKSLKIVPNQKNGRFRCFFHISSNKKRLTVKILFILICVVVPVVINKICDF